MSPNQNDNEILVTIDLGEAGGLAGESMKIMTLMTEDGRGFMQPYNTGTLFDWSLKLGRNRLLKRVELVTGLKPKLVSIFPKKEN